MATSVIAWTTASIRVRTINVDISDTVAFLVRLWHQIGFYGHFHSKWFFQDLKSSTITENSWWLAVYLDSNSNADTHRLQHRHCIKQVRYLVLDTRVKKCKVSLHPSPVTYFRQKRQLLV
jgi:hypothetical protein